MVMDVDWGIRSERGVSKVVGVVLLVAIVLLLALTTGAMLGGMAETPDEPSLSAVTFDGDRFDVDITAHSSLDNGDELAVKVNGETEKVWSDFSAGTTKSIQCVTPGDTISIVSTGQKESYTIREYTVKQRTDCRFEVSVGSSGPTQQVSPIGWNSDSEEFDNFYSYAHAHAHIDPSSSVINADSSYMFFYEYDDTVALVLVHDLPQEHGPGIPGSDPNDHSSLPAVGQPDYEYTGPSDTGGGAVDMIFDGLPSAGSWVLKDDPNDWTHNNCDAVSNRVCWSWAAQNTDGGIYAGGFEDPDNVDITVTADWHTVGPPSDTINDGWINDINGGKIDDDGWKFLYATDDGIKAIQLDKAKQVHIEGLETSP